MLNVFTKQWLLPVCTGLLLSTGVGSVLAADFFYTVLSGDHPWNLAQRYLKSPSLYSKLRQYNNIPDEYRIQPGTRLRVPQEWLKLETAQVRLLAVYGEATVRTGDSERPAAIGELLQAPATLRTGPTGSATLEFTDGSRVLVRRDSELQLRQTQRSLLGKANLIELALLKGSAENQITPMTGSGGRFEIRTPAAVAAVRGTEFRVEVRGDELRTEVLGGLVNVANAQGKVNAAAGQGSIVQSGRSPGQVVSLLAAPSLDKLPERIERLPIDWPVNAVPGAAAYRTQLAPDAQFHVAVSDETSPAARLRARDVEDGSYVVRVRAIDAQGLEGFSAQRTLVVHARPEPPLLMEPAPDRVTDVARPQFLWAQADPNWRYRLQIMAGDSKTPMHEQVVASGVSPQPPQDLPPGVYQWRVAAIHPAKGQGPWGDAQPFRRVLPGPGVEAPQIKAGEVTLRWASQTHAARYRMQVSRDKAFVSPLADVQTEAAQYSLKDLAPGTHYVRVQSTGADGYTGPWGNPQSFVMPDEPQYWPALLLLLLPLL